VERTGSTHGGWLSVAFDPHGRRIVTGGIDSTVAVWDATSAGPPITTFQWGVGPVYAVTFDRDGLRAAAAGHSGAIVWDVDE
jgi:WD40 repeat protein